MTGHFAVECVDDVDVNARVWPGQNPEKAGRELREEICAKASHEIRKKSPVASDSGGAKSIRLQKGAAGEGIGQKRARKGAFFATFRLHSARIMAAYPPQRERLRKTPKVFLKTACKAGDAV
jgi:hypothetical protein